MNLKNILISLIILTGLFSCQDLTKEEGIGYSEYINTQNLVENIMSNYPSGQTKAAIYTVDGDTEGLSVKEIHYFENGKTQVEGTLKNAKRHGIWTFYHDNGNIWSTGEFDNGNSVGLFQIFKKNGQIKIKTYYQNNKKIKEEYFEKGQLKKTVDL